MESRVTGNIDLDRVDRGALNALRQAAQIAGFTFQVTSNYRGPGHAAHSEKPCTAFDIRCSTNGAYDSHKAFKIVSACIAVGFHRVGINNKNHHIHVDKSRSRTPNVLWIE